ncbi:MAG: hypothetical protein GX664_04180 [Bacteroidales bacterium]|nr:hypothetical protein [Bacteroidales bacterium]
MEFKTVSAFVAHLESIEDTAVDKQYVIDTLKEITARPASGQRRGQLAGLTLEEMTDEQLKREIINAKSVLYKAIQRGASQETIEKNQARVDAALEEKARRESLKAEAQPEEEEVYSEQAEF